MKDFEVFRKAVKNENNIYRFLIKIYDFLDGIDIATINKKYESFISKGNKEIDEKIDYISNVDDNDFSSVIDLLVEYISYNNDYIIGIMFYLLKKIDEYMCDIMYDKGLLEHISSPIEEYDGYILSAKDTVSNFYEKLDINIERNLLISDVNDVCNDIKNYEILSRNRLCGYTVNIHRCRNLFAGLNSIKITTAPISKEPWFITKLNGVITIEYEDKGNNKNNNRLIKILDQMDDNGINIALFPELSANNKTKDFLIRKLPNKDYKNLKLIVAGTNLSNRKNVVYIFDRFGTLLTTSDKQKSSYKYKDDKKVYEDIEKTKEISLIDIMNVGRFAFPICLDIHDDDLTSVMFSKYHSNYMLSPVYSTKTNGMKDKSEYLAKGSYVYSVLCNSCAIVKNNNYRNYYIHPYMSSNKLIGCSIEGNIKDKECNNICNQCFNVYTIDICKDLNYE